MTPLLAASLLNSQLWYAIPLIVAISLVYGATRHELLLPILEHSARIAIWIVGFIAVIASVLLFICWFL